MSNGTTPKRKHEKIVAALLLIQLLRARQSFSRDAFSSFFYKKFDNLEGPKFLGILYIKIDIWSSVRGMQYVPHVTIKAKISKEAVHKMSFATFRIWPLALWPYPERCKDLAFFR